MRWDWNRTVRAITTSTKTHPTERQPSKTKLEWTTGNRVAAVRNRARLQVGTTLVEWLGPQILTIEIIPWIWTRLINGSPNGYKTRWTALQYRVKSTTKRSISSSRRYSKQWMWLEAILIYCKSTMTIDLETTFWTAKYFSNTTSQKLSWVRQRTSPIKSIDRKITT